MLSPDAPQAHVDAARSALVDETGVGDWLGVGTEAAGPGDATVVTHYFKAEKPGYVGWHWAVTLAVLPEGAPTVDEVVLLPGVEAITAPAWVPYRERLQPGDLSPGDLLPVSDEDPRLVPTYSFGDDPLDSDAKAQIRQVATDLGLGRVRTLSPEGLDQAAERWWHGPAGPEAPIAQSAPHPCSTCGFLLRLSGSLAQTFGVCANRDANDDGRVVAFSHGCGAHSEVRLARKHEPVPVPEPVVDDLTPELLETF
ncbi:DUF3027 domain-containing protein [Nocardioides sp. Kera G14]|uniref:DUF3027 domain-containing protein n=1 Tax=Nocardioides sp. Kera G14 TaxID=2884264 RepID=UPI001D123EE9|nr:DUF3027 domain-containing protein [Nocardioides sp. Kera G14]UDY25332.1 DUF3027 domain-containing protein [Nocardioides sp. Kera G14]